MTTQEIINDLDKVRNQIIDRIVESKVNMIACKDNGMIKEASEFKQIINDYENYLVKIDTMKQVLS